MNKKISQFNKEVISEFKELMKKCRNYEKEFILNSSKNKDILLAVKNEDNFNQSYIIKNIDYIKNLIDKNEIKVTTRFKKRLNVILNIYLFDDLLIIEDLEEDSYRVTTKEKVFNLNDYDSDYEILDSFLNNYIKAD